LRNGLDDGEVRTVLGHRLGIVGATVVAAALVPSLAACGDDGGDAGTTTEPTADTTTTTAPTATTLDAEAEVEAAYLAYWAMNKRLAAAPDPDDPEIPERATGSARDHLVDSLTTLLAQGRRYEFGPEDRHEVASLDVQADTATVRGCAVADASLVNASGEVRRLALTTTLLEAELARSNGTWLVTTVSELDSWDGSTTCDI
jgi:hypothetical protein